MYTKLAWGPVDTDTNIINNNTFPVYAKFGWRPVITDNDIINKANIDGTKYSQTNHRKHTEPKT